MSATFRVIQDGINVASVYGQDEEKARSEAMHYGMMYSQDGPCQIQQKVGRKWILVASWDEYREELDRAGRGK